MCPIYWAVFLMNKFPCWRTRKRGLAVLKSFVSVKGTKRQMSSSEVAEYIRTLGKPLEDAPLQEALQKFIHLRILRDMDQHNSTS